MVEHGACAGRSGPSKCGRLLGDWVGEDVWDGWRKADAQQDVWGSGCWSFVGRSERRGASVSAGTRSEVRPRSPPQRIELLLPAGRVPPQRLAIASHQSDRRRKKGTARRSEAPTRGPEHDQATRGTPSAPCHRPGRKTHRGRKQTRRNEQTGDDRRHATRRPLTRGSSDNARTDETQTNAPEDRADTEHLRDERTKRRPPTDTAELPPTRQPHHRLPHHKRMACPPGRTAPARQPHRLPRPHDRRQPNQLRPRRRLPARQRRTRQPRSHDAPQPNPEPSRRRPRRLPRTQPKRISQHRTLPPRTTPTDIHHRLIPSPQPPHRNNRNNTESNHRTPPQRKTDTAQPRRPLPAFATRANLGGPHGIRRELFDRRVFRVTLEADWRLVGIPARGAAPAASTAGDRWFRRPANP